MEQNVSQQDFRNCLRCGRPTPIDNPACEHCGLRPEELLAAVREEARTRRFVNALVNRSNPFTYLFIGMNLGMFALLWLAGGMDVLGADHRALVALGAKENSLIDQGQYWRFVTSMFLHIGFIHLFFNNYALWIVGQEIERLYGAARFVSIYLLTGLAGSVASYFYKPDATSAGASGAIFGLFGLLATFAFRYRKEIPQIISSQIKRQVIPLIAINLGIGFFIPMVDNSAHIGGLLTGVLLGLIVPYKRPEEKKTPVLWRALQIVSLAVIAVSFISAFRAYNGPAFQAQNLTVRPGARMRGYLNGMNQASQVFIDSVNSSHLSDSVKGNRASVTRAMSEADRGLQILGDLPPMEDEAERYKERLRDLLTRQKSILERVDPENPQSWSQAQREQEQLIGRYKEFEKEFEEWLPGYLAKHGLEVKKPPPNQNPDQ